MTSRCYLSLIRAQQEEDWPCSISLPQSLASTQVSNYHLLDILQVSFPRMQGEDTKPWVTDRLWQVTPLISPLLPPSFSLSSPPWCAVRTDPWRHQMLQAELLLTLPIIISAHHYFTLEELVKSSLRVTSRVDLEERGWEGRSVHTSFYFMCENSSTNTMSEDDYPTVRFPKAPKDLNKGKLCREISLSQRAAQSAMGLEGS